MTTRLDDICSECDHDRRCHAPNPVSAGCSSEIRRTKPGPGQGMVVGYCGCREFKPLSALTAKIAAQQIVRNHLLAIQKGMQTMLKAGFARADLVLSPTTLEYPTRAHEELHRPDAITFVTTRDGRSRVKIVTHVVMS